MATSNEQKGLLFLAAVAVLAAAVRFARLRDDRADPAAQPELAAQIQAADSVWAERRNRPSGRGRGASGGTRTAARSTSWERVDVDTASAATLIRLPGIGPALAGRIIENRDANGPFGSLAALGTVRGIGPATLRRLDTLVTFSGPAGPARAPPDPQPAAPGVRSRAHRVAGGR